MALTSNLLRLSTAVMVAAAVSLPARAAEATFEKTLQVTGPVHLEVRTDSGSIAVRPGGTGSVVVKGIMRTSRRWPLSDRTAEEALRRLQSNPPVEQSGQTVRIGEMIRPEDQKHISTSYEILVPPDTRLNAHSDSGSQTIDGIRGPVDVGADSGSIRLSNIGSEVHAQTDSGRVEADGIQGGMRAHSDSGGIHASRIAGDIDVSADSGGIHLQQTAAAPIRATCDSGGITVELAAAGYDISAHTDSGGIDADVPLTISGKIKQNQLEGKIRGGGPQVTLHTDSGSIAIR